MATNYNFEGKVIQYAAAADIASGAVVWAGPGLPGVALTAIASGASGSVAVSGVFSLAKHNHATAANGTAFAIGDAVHWDAANSRCCKTSVFPVIGYAVEAAGGSATTVKVLLSGKEETYQVEAAATIAAGQLLYISGWNATLGMLKVNLADADAGPPAGAAVLVALEAAADAGDIFLAGKTYVLTAQNTDAVTAAGDPVYLHTTAGGWTKDAPTTNRHTVQQVGTVLTKHASTGQILIHLGLSQATTYSAT